MDLSNKTILVTGASSGIGRGIAILLSNTNAKLIITGRDNDRLDRTLEGLGGHGHVKVSGDLTSEDDIEKLINSIEKLDGVVFCAGIVDYLPVKFLTSEKISKIFKINFESPVLLTQKLLKNKKISKKSSLVYVSSLSSKLGVAGTSMYAASKAALSSFAKVLATELAGQQIRVNALSPGIVRTPMTESSDLALSQEEMNDDEKKYPLGFGNVDDVANYVAFLLSDSSSWITGSDLVLDGGFTLN